LDSLRYAIDYCFTRKLIRRDQAQIWLATLLQTASKVTSTPGHFAQYLQPKDVKSWKYIRSQRRRSIWEEFISSLQQLSPYGSPKWRSINRTFRQDALALPRELRNGGPRPAVIYADPPYSEDQYSRYYHVLETLVLYDYPAVSRKGRYRDDRFMTEFSRPNAVGRAFVNLAEGSSKLGANLLISYPRNGLLHKKGGNLVSVLYDHYDRVDVIELSHRHSTLGGRHGTRSSEVDELLFFAKEPKL
jgi:adenine-specific DNA-methyltransferase